MQSRSGKQESLTKSTLPESCSVCLEVVSDLGQRSTAKLKCGHHFHLDCIGSAFNAKGAMQCPNCRHVEDGQWLYASGSRWSDDNDISIEDVSYEDDYEVYQAEPDLSLWSDEISHDDLHWSHLQSLWCPYQYANPQRTQSLPHLAIGGVDIPHTYPDLVVNVVYNLNNEDVGSVSADTPLCPHIAAQYPQLHRRQGTEETQTRPSAHGPDGRDSRTLSNAGPMMVDGSSAPERWVSTERGSYGYSRRGVISALSGYTAMNHNIIPTMGMTDAETQAHGARMESALPHPASSVPHPGPRIHPLTPFLPLPGNPLGEAYENFRWRWATESRGTSLSSPSARAYSPQLQSHQQGRSGGVGGSPSTAHDSDRSGASPHGNMPAFYGSSSSRGNAPSSSHLCPRSSSDYTPVGSTSLQSEYYCQRQHHEVAETSAAASSRTYANVRRAQAISPIGRPTRIAARLPARAPPFPPPPAAEQSSRRSSTPLNPWQDASASPLRRETSGSLASMSPEALQEFRTLMRSVPNSSAQGGANSNGYRHVEPMGFNEASRPALRSYPLAAAEVGPSSSSQMYRPLR